MSSIPTTELAPPDPVTLATIGSAAEYRIGPLDALDIAVFQAPDLTRAVKVDAAGHINLPLIGQVPAAGRTPTELQSELATLLQAKYMQSPQVSVTVREFASQKVTVDGAVLAPGVYPISGRTTLLQAVALAKGPDPRMANEKQVVIFRTVDGQRMANEKQVVIFRTVDGQRMAARFDLSAIRAGAADDPQVYGNDVVVVDRSGTRGMLREVLGALPLVSVFKPLLF